MRVSGHNKFAFRLGKSGAVIALVKELVGEVFSEEVGNELSTGFAAGTEVHFDFSGLEIQRDVDSVSFLQTLFILRNSYLLCLP